MTVLHLDNHLLVVSKPPGLLAQADRTGDADVLTEGKAFLKKEFDKPGGVYLGLVHRLDRPASGVMALARTSKAARRLSEQFRRHLPEKRYLALVEGACSGMETCVDYIAKEGEEIRRVPPGHPAGKRAELTYQALAQDAGAGVSLVMVRLKTGRPHQIRVQLAARGFPVLGDFRHGAKRELDGQNLALHAYLLRLEHPVRREMMAFAAPPPPAWGGLFERETERLLAAAA